MFRPAAEQQRGGVVSEKHVAATQAGILLQRTLHHCAVVCRAHFTFLSEVHQLRPVVSHFAARIDTLATSVWESLTTPSSRVPWEANNSPASQISRISWNPQFYYRAHNPDQCSSCSTFYLLQFVFILSFILRWGRKITLKLFCQKPVSSSSLHILATRLEDKYQKQSNARYR